MYATTDRQNRRRTVQVAAASLALLLVACSAQGSPSESLQVVNGSETQEPSTATATAGPSVASSAVPPADVTTVTISGRSFGAPEITVAVGKVTFINADTVPHTVTEGQDGVSAPSARFDEVVAVGAAIDVTFPEPGVYQITCLFHSEMHLLVHAH